jgi:FMN phosphatase YigB (HAD superfamily)
LKRLQKYYKLIPLSNIDHASLDRTISGPLDNFHFDATYIAEDIGSYKPDLRNFNYLLDHLKSDFGVEKDELCHIAQSLFHDHPATKQMGIRSVWVDRYDVLEERSKQNGETLQDMQQEFRFVWRVTTVGEVADAVEEAFKVES